MTKENRHICIPIQACNYFRLCFVHTTEDPALLLSSQAYCHGSHRVAADKGFLNQKAELNHFNT